MKNSTCSFFFCKICGVFMKKRKKRLRKKKKVNTKKLNKKKRLGTKKKVKVRKPKVKKKVVKKRVVKKVTKKRKVLKFKKYERKIKSLKKKKKLTQKQKNFVKILENNKKTIFEDDFTTNFVQSFNYYLTKHSLIKGSLLKEFLQNAGISRSTYNKMIKGQKVSKETLKKFFYAINNYYSVYTIASVYAMSEELKKAKKKNKNIKIDDIKNILDKVQNEIEDLIDLIEYRDDLSIYDILRVVS